MLTVVSLSTINIQFDMLSSTCTRQTSSSSHQILSCSRHDIAKKFTHLVLNNNDSLNQSMKCIICFIISDVFFVDYYCGLIYNEIRSIPAKESDLIRILKRQNVSTEDVKKCLQQMETNELIRKTRRSTDSDPFWQLVSELQSLDYQEEDAEPSSGSLKGKYGVMNILYPTLRLLVL